MCDYSPIINWGNLQSTPLAKESLTEFLTSQTSSPPDDLHSGGLPVYEAYSRALRCHSQVFSSPWFLAVSHLQEGQLSRQRATLHSSVTLCSVKITPSCLFCWPVEDGVHTQIWPWAADGTRKLRWMEKTRPGGENAGRVVVKTRALNFKLWAMEAH